MTIYINFKTIQFKTLDETNLKFKRHYSIAKLQIPFEEDKF